MKIDVSVLAPARAPRLRQRCLPVPVLVLMPRLCSFVDGVHGDNCHTFYAGTPAPAARALVECTHDCMMKAIAGGNQPSFSVPCALGFALFCACSVTALSLGRLVGA